ncbi:YfhO family protein [Olegusella massiliensis]|uniref:YfhO family protein n=1 Tax=Olegusella massiliensis TaxID=1776381 RepID=UPI0023F8CE51|nr:YfhO family protein [Olegusella massiliensis]
MHLRPYLYLLAVFALALLVFVVAFRFKDKLTHTSEKRSGLELILLSIILLLGITAILRNHILGVGNVTLAFRRSANDTFDQYIPYYLSMIRSLKQGTLPLWNSTYGMGTSILGNQSWSFDPFNLILLPLCLIFGEGFLAQALALTFAARALASGLLFSHVLKYYCKVPLARIFGATSYGLGGYLFTEGQHFFFGTAWVFLPLLLITLEWFMDKQNTPSFIFISIVTAAFICFSAYLSFITLLFIPLYVAFRLLVVGDKWCAKTYFKQLGLAALSVFAGCLIAGIILVPSVYFLVHETARINGEHAESTRSMTKMLSLFLSPHSFMLLLSRLMGNGLISSGTNYHYLELGGLNELEFFQGGLSCGVFILLAQFFHWVFSNTSRREKIAITVASCLIAFYCINYFLPSLLTVFRYPTYRGCLLIDAVLIIALSLALEKRFIESSPAIMPLVLSVPLSLFVLYWSWSHSVNAAILCIFFAILTINLTILFIARIRCPQAAAALALGACVVLISSVVADAFCEIHLNPKIVSPKHFPCSNSTTDGDDTIEALNYLEQHDPSFYRSERTYITWNKWNDSMSFGYRGISSYNSSEDGDLTRFYLQLWPEVIAKDAGNFYCYAFKKDSNNPQMMALTGIRYVISHTRLNYSWAQELTVTSNGMYVYEVKYGTQQISPLYIRTTALSDSEADALSLEERRSELDHKLIIDAESLSSLKLPTNTTATATVNLKEAADGSLSGNIDTTGDCLACLTVPNISDWIIRIDGQEVPTFKANYGFVGFKLSAGTHVIQAHHQPAALLIGAFVSAAGVILLLAGIWLTKRTQYAKTSQSQPANHMKISI